MRCARRRSYRESDVKYRVPHSDLLVRRDLRPALARVMCRCCARRWLAGAKIWHAGCARELAYAFDLYFERVAPPCSC